MDSVQSSEIGRKSEGEVGCATLRIGTTSANFQEKGKIEELRERLKRSRIRGNITGKPSLKVRQLIPSGPQKLFFKFENASTSRLGVTWLK